jgi:DNA-binding IclR family transcriptional regulator
MEVSLDKNNCGTIIKSVQKGLNILKFIMNSNDEVSIQDIEEKYGYNISTIHHQLKTLSESGFVSQNKRSKKYTIGAELFTYGLLHSDSESYLKRLDPLLAESVLKTGETTNLFVRSNQEVLCIRGIESHCLLKANLQIGRRLPITEAAAGRVFLPPDNNTRYLNNKLRYEVEENVLDTLVSAIAVPIIIDEEVQYSLCVILPSMRVLDGTVEAFAKILHETSKKMIDLFG